MSPSSAQYYFRRTRYTLLHARFPKFKASSVRSPRGLKASNTADTHGKAAHVEGFPEEMLLTI